MLILIPQTLHSLRERGLQVERIGFLPIQFPFLDFLAIKIAYKVRVLSVSDIGPHAWQINSLKSGVRLFGSPKR